MVTPSFRSFSGNFGKEESWLAGHRTGYRLIVSKEA